MAENKKIDSLNVRIQEREGEEGAPTLESCSLSIEIESDDNEGSSSYAIGSTYFARVYASGNVSNLSSFSTNGTFSSAGTGTTSITDEVITFSGTDSASLPSKYSSGFSYEVIGLVYDSNGDIISDPGFRMEGTDGFNVYSSKKCYASIKVSYVAEYYIYRFNGTETGEAQLVVTGICNEEDQVASTTVTFSEEVSSAASDSSSTSLGTTSITITYKDFVTGERVSNASVWVDEEYAGTTNDQGQITLTDITTNTTHKIKASKEGYITTDSDSLANDQFIINT